ncbi:MAG: hypothetical protein K5798_09540 [Nitrosopumilus sp.]|uniref:hypothetical protein n=1 Tax=Nitrosopumilus sp. TaxID=2024843 RepID=UPI00242C629B|nr:hypothetical protein [Nitrosopumilus sp.]MCV0367486.1 hypothetical protein [Nitrosopumilus sp.]
MTESFSDLLSETVKQNEEFFKNDPYKKFLAEIVALADDSIDIVPKSQDMSDPRTAFWFHALQPMSYGIFVSFISGNLLSCFMQLRLLVEYLALYFHSKHLSGDNLLEKFQKIRDEYDDKSISNLLRDFDKSSLKLWKSLSKWHHAIPYSARIELATINEGAKLWSIIQPAFYSKEDESELHELFIAVTDFRKLLNKYV